MMNSENQKETQIANVSVSELSATRFLITGLSGLLGLSVLMAWFLTSYFGINYAASLSFPGNDGWCPNQILGFGNHCWGDYSAIRFESIRSAPSAAEAVYPLTTRLFRLPFWLIDQIGGFRLGLLVFVSLMAVLLVAPIWHASRGRPASERSIIILLTAVATSPYLVTLDRGNLIFLLAPACYMYLLGLKSRHTSYIVSATILSALIKPQFALLLLALLAMRRYRSFFLSIAALIVSYGSLYLVFAGEGVRSAFQTTVESSRQWSASTDVNAAWPQNQSFEHAIIGVFHSIGIESVVSPGSLKMIGVLILFTLVAILTIRCKEAGLPVFGIALVIVASYSTPTSYAYYSVTSLSIVAYIVKQDHGTEELIAGTRVSGFMLLIALICSLTPLVVPMEFIRIEVGGPSLVARNLMNFVVPLAWLMFLISITIQGRHLRPLNRAGIQTRSGRSDD